MDLEVELGPESAGKRLDLGLTQALAAQGVETSRSALRRSFDAGLVTVDGQVVKARAVIDRGMVVHVTLVDPAPMSALPEDLPLVVLFEDDAVLVVDKAASMVVHPSLGHPGGTLVNAVLYHLGARASDLPVLPGNDATRPGIVHRLDRDTSGVMVIAKTAAAQACLAPQFEKHTIERRYTAVLRDVPAFENKRVVTTHGRDPADRRRFAAVKGAKRKAATEVEIVRRFRAPAVEAKFLLHTGRTHQIRMHARLLGHPVFGDDLYGSPPRVPMLRALWEGLGRHALHAEVLGFDHPDGRRLRFTAPLPPELVALIVALDADDDAALDGQV